MKKNESKKGSVGEEDRGVLLKKIPLRTQSQSWSDDSPRLAQDLAWPAKFQPEWNHNFNKYFINFKSRRFQEL